MSGPLKTWTSPLFFDPTQLLTAISALRPRQLVSRLRFMNKAGFKVARRPTGVTVLHRGAGLGKHGTDGTFTSFFSEMREASAWLEKSLAAQNAAKVGHTRDPETQGPSTSLGIAGGMESSLVKDRESVRRSRPTADSSLCSE